MKVMKIGIEINGVLRDTLKKIQQEYEKWYIDNPFSENNDDFKYEVFSDVESLNIRNHLKFKSDEELYDFLYKEHTMEIFGHAGSVEFTTMNDLNDLYINVRDNHDIILVSDEIGKSKPATLFFLSKYGCLIESIKFYSELTINCVWDSIDVLLTANPDLLLNHPADKKVIKYETKYNQEITADYKISKLKDLELELNKIIC